MSKQDLLRIQSCILKVNIHCDGCAQKVKKLLQKIDGVYSVNIDAEQGKVLVVGDVDPAKLIKKLKRSGKHAEIWGGQRGMMYNNHNHPINHQFQNLQVHDSKGGKDNKSQNQKGQKGVGVVVVGGQGQPAHFPNNIKGAQDLKVPPKGHKSVKFNLAEEEFDASDEDYYDEFEANFEDYDEDEDEDEEEGYGHGHPMDNKRMPVIGNGGGPRGPAGMMNGPSAMNNSHKGGPGGNYNHGSGKKGDVIDQAMKIKGKGGNHNEAKNGNKGGKKNDGDQRDKNSKKGGGGGNNKKNAKSDGGLLGRFLGFGKKSKKGGGATDTYKNKSKYNGGKEEKKGEAKFEGNSNKNKGKNDFDFDDHDIDIPRHEKSGKSGKGNGNGNGNVGQMGPMGINNATDNIPAMNGGGGGYHQGMQMQPPPPYSLEQQQYMAMMMNQQRQRQQANMNNMYPPAMMYGRPSHPSMNYMPPPPMPSHPMADPITHTFSDENVESCSIM